MTKAGKINRVLYIRRKTKWLKVGTISYIHGKVNVRLNDNVDLILEEVFE
tara:strand:+ start:1388 stop:1537 length:150 start_codon:yes stop_codon:yes gene_type:complete